MADEGLLTENEIQQLIMVLLETHPQGMLETDMRKVISWAEQVRTDQALRELLFDKKLRVDVEEDELMWTTFEGEDA